MIAELREHVKVLRGIPGKTGNVLYTISPGAQGTGLEWIVGSESK